MVALLVKNAGQVFDKNQQNTGLLTGEMKPWKSICKGRMWCRYRQFLLTLSAHLKLVSELFFGGENSETKRAAIVLAVTIFFSVKSCCKIYRRLL